MSECILDIINYHDFELSGYICNKTFKRELNEIFPNIINKLNT